MERFYKALIPLVTAGAAVLSQWLATKHFSLTAEFVSACFGVVSALLVYLVPNLYTAAGLAAVRKALVPLATGTVALVTQWVATGHFNVSQEYVTSALAVLTAVFVYLVPNIGDWVPRTERAR